MGDPSWLTASPATTQNGAVNRPALTTPSFKVILVGEAGVGKTAIFSRVRQPEQAPCQTQSSASIGVDTCTRTVGTAQGDVTITLWDTAGAEKYRTLTRNYYRNTQAAVLVFSVEDPPSLYSLPDWQKDVCQSAPGAVQFLVGNKSDLDHHVTDQSMRCFADSHNCQAAFLISAKTGEGVENALSAICSQLLRQRHHGSGGMHSGKDFGLWLEDPGLHVHGSEDTTTEPGAKCCSSS